MTLEIQIDRVLLDGYPFTAAERDLFSRALEGELTRLFAEAGPASAGAGNLTAAAVVAPPIPSQVRLDASSLGAEVARSVFHGIGRAGV